MKIYLKVSNVWTLFESGKGLEEELKRQGIVIDSGVRIDSGAWIGSGAII